MGIEGTTGDELVASDLRDVKHLTKIVQAFHDKMQCREPQRMEDDAESDVTVIYAATKDVKRALAQINDSIASRGCSINMLRCQLIVEEVHELLIAIYEEDEIAACDAITDLVWVLVGTLIQFDLPPLEEIIDEVRRSNMSKDPAGVEKRLSGDRGKGATFVPPDIKKVLDRHRAKKGRQQS